MVARDYSVILSEQISFSWNERGEALSPQTEVSVLEAMVQTLCSGTMVRILLKTHRKGFMLGKATVGEG